MVGSRTATALAGLAVSVVVTLVLYWQFDTLAVLLFLPFVPFLFANRNGGGRTTTPEPLVCPNCGFETTRDDYEFCPRDGHRLERNAR